MSLDSERSGQLQVRLLTEDASISVPPTALSVPAKIDPRGLQNLVLKLLEEDGNDHDDLNLEFLLLDDFLRGPLDEFLAAKGDAVAGAAETVLEVHYLKGHPTPEPHRSVNHDDWVSGVAVRGGFALTACYDHSVSIFDLATGERRLSIPGHAGPARAVAWVSLDENHGVFASSSHDQTVALYRWNVLENAVEAVNSGRGHERSVDCLAVDAAGKRIASGSFDTNLKIWGATLEARDDPEPEERDSKKSKKDSKAVTRTPVLTLAGHKEGISGVAFTEDENEVVTASWDHTIKIWDLEMGGMKTELVGNRSFFGLSYSPVTRTIVTASADRAIRLYDPRSKDGVIVKSQYTSHQGWVTCVDWSRKGSEHHLLSGGHDTVLKMWDVRSCKTPLFDLKGHDDRILCCSWGEPGCVVSGGADNCMKIFKTGMQGKKEDAD